jgi:HD-GYP domain-containing protein (c-di-GMP phosphodiesterase class II)
VARIVRHHHEHYDGSGYPEGTAGEAIPIGSRILALADAYHAMASDRPHRPRRPHDEILKALRDQRGRQFDPTLTDVLVSVVSPLTPALSPCGREGESNG